MAQDEREQFIEWSAAIGMDRNDALELLKYLPTDDILDPELQTWLCSPSYCMAENDPARAKGFTDQLVKEGYLIRAGFIVIGMCPNGDSVLVSFRDSGLPVFYLSHEELYAKPFTDVIKKISDSIAAYDEALLNEDSGIPLDYYDTNSN